MNKEIKKKERAMYIQTLLLKKKYWNTKDYFRARELQKEERELYNKQQFYSKLIKEMEKEEK